MKKQYSLIVIAALVLLMTGSGCKSSTTATPKEVLNKYFSSAVSQDYATTYNCYYGAYKAKINKDEYIRHRKEASALQSYDILAVNMEGDKAAHAEVKLTFAPSEKLGRKEPVSTVVKEDMIKEEGEWKIKVW
ncbi:MAG TPA: hypothetical protein VLD55_02870 [Candidatus Sulfobium mesophilum]|nr:hypothetical protein [Candidatus Sulfobium mesophilum]